MLFRQFFDQTSSTYSYLIARSPGREALIIDPVLERLELYLQTIREFDLNLRCALDTHIHADHITALGRLRKQTNCLTRMGRECRATCISSPFTDGEIIEVDGVFLKALHTPGHTDDSYCLLMQDRIFTGDTLLIRSSGRTDFPNGDPLAAWESLQKLLTLPDETLVYPAHDYQGRTVSTIGEKRRFNPRLQVCNAKEYAAIMNNLHLPTPKQMDVAIPANRACGEQPGRL